MSEKEKWVDLPNGFRFSDHGRMVRYENFEWKEYTMSPEKCLALLEEHFEADDDIDIKDEDYDYSE
jgi:hypothetical protein